MIFGRGKKEGKEKFARENGRAPTARLRRRRRRRQLFSGRCSGEQILIMPTDRPTANEPTLSEIYVSSKCETNSALPSFLPSQQLPLSILRIWSSNADQTVRRAEGSYTGEAREGGSLRERKRRANIPLPSLLPSFFLSSFVLSSPVLGPFLFIYPFSAQCTFPLN